MNGSVNQFGDDVRNGGRQRRGGSGSGTSRVWSFTIHSPYDTQVLEEVLREGLDTQKIKRYIFQEEEGESGTPHLQGFIRCCSPLRINGVKLLLGSSHAHVERSGGTDHENRVYCSKEQGRLDGPFEGGDWGSQQGKRRDLESIKEWLDEGWEAIDVAREDVNGFSAFLKYNSGMTMYSNALKVKRTNRAMEVIYWYGATGSGKTRGVYERFNAEDVYVVTRPTNGSLYYDGYNGQPCILFDDFYGWAPLSHMLNIMDRYQMKLKIHGGFVDLLDSTTTIVITSNNHYDDIYDWTKFSEELKSAFIRRITEVKQFIRLRSHDTN